ncbi:MAG: hypothetical protein CM15mV18_1330 [uncultured marine virus]|nr:MAG: hypothetical protein CM15mV18_1330 [uncultured marine virus]
MISYRNRYIANTTSSEIKVDVYVNDGSNDYYLIKNVPYSIRWYFTNYRRWGKIRYTKCDVVKVVSDTVSSVMFG